MKREEEKPTCRSCGGDWPCTNDLCMVGKFLSNNPVVPHHWERHHMKGRVPLGPEQEGRVRKWRKEEGYGFITPIDEEGNPARDDNGRKKPDVYVHITSFSPSPYGGGELIEGERVTFREATSSLTPGKTRAEEVTGPAVSFSEEGQGGKDGILGGKKGKGKDGKGKGHYDWRYTQSSSKCLECGGPFPCRNEDCFKSKRRPRPRPAGRARGAPMAANPEGRTLGAVASSMGGQSKGGKRLKEGGGYCCGCGVGGLLLRPSPLSVGLGPGLYCEACIERGHRGVGPGGRGRGKGRGLGPIIPSGPGRGAEVQQ